jgi:hypothetical protein
MTENQGESRDGDDNAFLESVARPLRSPEFLAASFETRLMEKIRREGSPIHPVLATVPPQSWWRTERVVRLSPLTGLAVAAGLAGVIALSSVVGGTRTSGTTAEVARIAPTPVAAVTDTVHVVRFVFVDPAASSVEIVGDFNAWTKGVTRLERGPAPGVWTASIPLTAGRHEYAFIINGSRWIADPLAPKSSDDFGVESAVIHVGPTQQSAT